MYYKLGSSCVSWISGGNGAKIILKIWNSGCKRSKSYMTYVVCITVPCRIHTDQSGYYIFIIKLGDDDMISAVRNGAED